MKKVKVILIGNGIKGLSQSIVDSSLKINLQGLQEQDARYFLNSQNIEIAEDLFYKIFDETYL